MIKGNSSLSIMLFIIFVGVIILIFVGGRFDNSEKFSDSCVDNGFVPLPVSCINDSLRSLYVAQGSPKRGTLMAISDFEKLTPAQQEVYGKSLTPSQQADFISQRMQFLTKGLMEMSDYVKLTSTQMSEYLKTLTPIQNYLFQTKYNQFLAQGSNSPQSYPQSIPQSYPQSTPQSIPESTPQSTSQSSPQSTPQSESGTFMPMSDFVKLTDEQRGEYTKTLTPSQRIDLRSQYETFLIQGLMAMSEYDKLTSKQKSDYLASLKPLQNYLFQNKYSKFLAQG